VLLDPDELIPRSGKDERFDEVVEEIASLEKELEGELKKFERTLGFV
jgi:DNA mismatch repair protein MSH6